MALEPPPLIGGGAKVTFIDMKFFFAMKFTGTFTGKE